VTGLCHVAARGVKAQEKTCFLCSAHNNISHIRKNVSPARNDISLKKSKRGMDYGH
jgi:hypothetical protein